MPSMPPGVAERGIPAGCPNADLHMICISCASPSPCPLFVLSAFAGLTLICYYRRFANRDPGVGKARQSGDAMHS